MVSPPQEKIAMRKQQSSRYLFPGLRDQCHLYQYDTIQPDREVLDWPHRAGPEQIWNAFAPPVH
jgi:hypothetical protein